jgi:hypothetical protein
MAVPMFGSSIKTIAAKCPFLYLVLRNRDFTNRAASDGGMWAATNGAGRVSHTAVYLMVDEGSLRKAPDIFHATSDNLNVAVGILARTFEHAARVEKLLIQPAGEMGGWKSRGSTSWKMTR